MNSHLLISPLSAADQAELARALPSGGFPGVAHECLVMVGLRRLVLSAVRAPSGCDSSAFSEVVGQRSDAPAYRLLPVVATGCHDDRHWVAYEVGRAKPLASERWRQWPVMAAVDLLADIGDALDDAALHGIAPYEIRPASIFVEPRLGPLLADLGSAREAFGNPPAEHDRNRAFVPPEVLSGRGPGPLSSVYACGALLHTLLAGEPPAGEPVTSFRGDQPVAIDEVVARAMASDPTQRYTSVAELCDSARLAAAAARVRRPVSEPEAPQPDGPPVTALAPPTPPQAKPRPAPGRPRWRSAASVCAALAIGAFGGLQTAAQDAPADDAETVIARHGIRMTLPAGWRAGVTRGDTVLSAYPSSDWFSGLSLSVTDRDVASAEQTDPVRLGSFDMWRDRSRAPESVRYVAPTTIGTLVISCEAAAGAPPKTIGLCERAVSTLQVHGAEGLPLAGVVDEPGIRAAVARLRRDRAAARRHLADARRPRVQREVATSLATIYGRAARRLAEFSEDGAVPTAAKQAAASYRALAAAAGSGKVASWNAAGAEVRRTESALAAVLRDGG
jgi:hypothetical protein